MDSMNQKCLAYFQEEVRQYKTMLNGILRPEYREYINMKLMYFEHVITLLEKEYENDRIKIT